MTDFSSVKEKNAKDVLMFLFASSTSIWIACQSDSEVSCIVDVLFLLKLPLSPGLRFLEYLLNLFWNCVSFKMDDDRELRITSGSIIGVIMLLIAMLPRDIRRDFVSRLNEMNLAQEREECNQVMIASDAPENEDMGHTTTASEGEVLEDPPALESDGELSELFEAE